MPYLLDTSVITQLLRRTPHIVDRYRATLERGEAIYLSAVVYYEVKRGLLHMGAARQLRQLDEHFIAPVPQTPCDALHALIWSPCSL